MMNKTEPMYIRNKAGEVVYTLEFTRETAVFTDRQGFRASEFEDRIREMLPILFYGAFRMHHRNLSRAETDDILFNKLKGLNADQVIQLSQLYGETAQSLVNEKDEEELKNAELTVG